MVANGPNLAVANHFSGATGNTSCTTLNRNDDNAVSVYYDDLTNEVREAYTWNRQNNLDPTDLNTNRVDNFVDGVNLVVLDRYYVDYCGRPWLQVNSSGQVTSGSTVGHTRCFDLVPGTQRCQTSDNRFTNHYMDNVSEFLRRHLTCHESGHAFGLAHYSNVNSCVAPTDPVTNTFSAHDKDAINAHY